MKDKLFGFLLTLVSCAGPAFAVSPSVVYVAFNGSDSSPSCSRPAPCQTITHALTVVAAGGVVDIVALVTMTPPLSPRRFRSRPIMGSWRRSQYRLAGPG